MAILPDPMQVVVALIARQDGALLVTQRPLHKPLGGFWEFPGGKLEQNEQPEQGLLRELSEELGIVPTQVEYLQSYFTQQETRTIELMVFFVKAFEGIPSMCEGQLDMRWVHWQDLRGLRFPEANCRIIDLIYSCKSRFFEQELVFKGT